MENVLNLHTLIDRHAIETALANHSRGLDRADENLLGSAYHPAGHVDYGAFIGSSEDFTAALAAGQKSGGPTQHRTSNISIRIKGDKAVSESYVIAYVEDAETQHVVFGRYLDSHEKHNGEWRLVQRIYSLEGNTNKPNNAGRADPDTSHETFLAYGGHGAADAGRVLLAAAQARHKSTPLTKETQAMGTQSANQEQNAQALDRALSKVAIHELCMSYCRAVDRGDKELMASLFAEGATVMAGVFNGDAAEFSNFICDFVQKNSSYVFHSVANEWVEINGDEAVGEHYVIAMMCSDGNDIMTGGRYIDRYVRRDGIWKIMERTFVMDWNRTDPTTMQLDGMYEGLEQRGRWGKDDPVYALWSSI